MKLNKQKIEDIKIKMKNIKQKITNNQGSKVPKKYYVLLMLMLMVAIITLSNNINKYSKSRKEDYTKYYLEDSSLSSTDNAQIENYLTAVSSINTTEPNMEEGVIETISSNSFADGGKYIMPVSGEIIKEYAVEKLVYSETLGMWKTHPGIDIKAEIESNVVSASSGVVQEVEKDSFYGNVVKVLEDNGYIFVYANLDDEIKLSKGDKINKGDVIGKIGVSATGELSDTAHLHFEVIKDENQINPLDLIN